MIFKVFVTILLLAVSTRAAEWGYGNVSEWGGLCASGTQQSPIDLIADNSAVEKIFSAFQFTGYDTFHPATVLNNGHTVTITLNATDVPTLSGGGLIGDYVLDHFHFHWESEHTVNGRRYPLEMHLVHYSTDYDDLSEAATYPDGVAVLGVLFELSIDDDEDFIPLIDVMESVIRNPEVEVDLLRPIAARNFLPRNTGDYYRYSGSLTTPDCNEGVIWTVFDRTLPLSANQINRFEAVWSKDGPLTLNYRPVQPLNTRVLNIRNVQRISGDGGGANSITASISIIALTALPVIKNYIL